MGHLLLTNYINTRIPWGRFKLLLFIIALLWESSLSRVWFFIFPFGNEAHGLHIWKKVDVNYRNFSTRRSQLLHFSDNNHEACANILCIEKKLNKWLLKDKIRPILVMCEFRVCDLIKEFTLIFIFIKLHLNSYISLEKCLVFLETWVMT